ncbi:MAG: hypothetical protein EXS38_08405 [Opitutus sp.]|nr:hypothetical protein [Opitutus sp.]
MTTAATHHGRHRPHGKTRRFFRTPKGVLTLLLALLSLLGTLGKELPLFAPGLAAALFAVMLVDAPILRLRERHWEFPSGALLTGLIIAMVLSPHESWYIAAATSAAAIVSKYLFRTHTANVFNPAALALLANFYVFGSGQSWWGALSESPPLGLIVLVAAGLFMADRVSRIPAVISFLGGYYLLLTLAAFLGDPARVASAFRPPDLNAALFFAFFMVTDPPTSPPRHRDQVVYGLIVAAVSYAVFALTGAIYFLLVGLLVANIWEARRRVRSRSGQ